MYSVMILKLWGPDLPSKPSFNDVSVPPHVVASGGTRSACFAHSPESGFCSHTFEQPRPKSERPSVITTSCRFMAE